jgi:hypothetical protein
MRRQVCPTNLTILPLRKKYFTLLLSSLRSKFETKGLGEMKGAQRSEINVESAHFAVLLQTLPAVHPKAGIQRFILLSMLRLDGQAHPQLQYGGTV